jgi:hypothetical protein
VPRHDAVRLLKSIGGEALDLALPADCPGDIGPGRPPLDLAIVGILRVGREKAEGQGGSLLIDDGRALLDGASEAKGFPL